MGRHIGTGTNTAKRIKTTAAGGTGRASGTTTSVESGKTRSGGGLTIEARVGKNYRLDGNKKYYTLITNKS